MLNKKRHHKINSLKPTDTLKLISYDATLLLFRVEYIYIYIGLEDIAHRF